jgi:hypothetical protein
MRLFEHLGLKNDSIISVLFLCSLIKKSELKKYLNILVSFFGDFLFLLFLFSPLLFFFWSFLFFRGIVEILFEFFKSVHGDLCCGGNTGCKFISTSSKSNFACSAFPDSTSDSLDA